VLRELCSPKSIIERNDSPSRGPEGLEPSTSVLFGEAPKPFCIDIDGIQMEVDLMGGQKTGFYLDQAANYAPIAAYARGKKVLDCFSNSGGFALACAKAGAAEVTALDVSEECIQQIRRNAERNGQKVDAQKADVFTILREYERMGRLCDIIVLDPPTFAKRLDKLNDARRGYKDIHFRALKLLRPGGLLATYCCAHHVSAAQYLEIINEAAVDAPATLRRIAQYSQNIDHPIVTTMPETEYLKGFLFELAPGR
jgi:23S rRNA (cytosine1962-C5)-methyltransferase